MRKCEMPDTAIINDNTIRRMNLEKAILLPVKINFVC